MRKSSLILFVLAIMFAIFSCKKEDFTEEEAARLASEADSLDTENLRDSLRHIGGVITYMINIYDAANTGSISLKSAAGFTLADTLTVTSSQYGIVVTKQVDPSGIVVFENMRIGTAAIAIRSQNGLYTDVDYIVHFPGVKLEKTDSIMTDYYYSSAFVTESYYDLYRNIASQIPVFALTGTSLTTIQGKVTAELDLTNKSPESPAGVQVIGTIDVNDSKFRSKFLTSSSYSSGECTECEGSGKIVRIAYSSIVSSATTGAGGTYSLQVPSTGDGLPIKIHIGNYVADQTLLVYEYYGQDTIGPMTIRTHFNDTISASYASYIPLVPPVTCEFSMPTMSEANLPSDTAAAVAYVSESGVAAIYITNPGEDYTQPPLVLVNGAGSGTDATATISGGKVTDITINDGGTGYPPDSAITVTLAESCLQPATAEVDVCYGIRDITVSNPGAGYGATAPNVTISSTMGSGGTAVANMSGYLADVTLTDGGTGYTAAPEAILSGGGADGTGASVQVIMSSNNPIHSISLDGLPRYPYAPFIEFSGSVSGSGAVATTTIGTSGGFVKGAYTLVPSQTSPGYVAPEVQFITSTGFGAVGYATLAADSSIASIIITNSGYGYAGSDQVRIVDNGGGVAGNYDTTWNGIIEFSITDITLSAAGNGYDYADLAVSLVDSFGGVIMDITANTKLDMFVDSVKVATGGSWYSTAPTINFVPVDGNGSGAAATAAIDYQVGSITVTSQGSGYFFSGIHPVVVAIDAAPIGGTNATATATACCGTICSVRLTNPGKGYYGSAPNVYITGGSPAEDAVITATLGADSSIASLTIDDPGYDYLSTPTIEIRTYKTAGQATAKANPTSGQIEFVAITNSGAGYSVPPIVEFEIPNGEGSGSGASATAVLVDGRVTEINVTAAGSGYYTAPNVRIVVSNYNLQAEGTVQLNDQGVVTGVTITEAGRGYDQVPTITFIPTLAGMGSGASANVLISGGIVTEVLITSGGQGYLAKNTPTDSKLIRTTGVPGLTMGTGFTIFPDGSTSFNVYSGKTYVKDIYLGTGIRETDFVIGEFTP